MALLRAGWIVSAAAFLILIVANLFHPPRGDEIFHVLAARGYLASGVFRIGDEGVYLRGWPISWSVAQIFRLFGDHVPAGRLVGVVPIVGLLALGAAWLRRRSGEGVALVWFALTALSPFILEIGSYLRWYGCTALMAALCFWGVMQAAPLRQRPSRRLIGVASTAVGFAGLALLQREMLPPIALITAIVAFWLVTTSLSRHRAVSFAMITLSILLVLLVALGHLGWLQRSWEIYRSYAQWSAARAGQPFYYHQILLTYYPTLWPMTGLLWLIGRRSDARTADSAAIVAFVGLAIHSGAAMKAPHYVAYLIPWLSLVWALGLHGAGQWLVEHRHIVPVNLSRGTVGLALAAVLFLLLANTATVRAITLSFAMPINTSQSPSDWDAVKPSLRSYVDEAQIMITTGSSGSLYQFGRDSFVINRSAYGELTGQAPFSNQPGGAAPEPAGLIRDSRTGTMVIRDEATLGGLLRCVSSALVVSSASRWQDPNCVPEGMRSFVERELVPIDLPPSSKVNAWWYRNLRPLEPCPDR